MDEARQNIYNTFNKNIMTRNIDDETKNDGTTFRFVFDGLAVSTTSVHLFR